MNVFRRPLAALLALGLLVGCASARESGRTPLEGDRGGVRVAVFADDDARSRGELLGEPISGVLERRSGDAWEPVFRSLEPSWAVVGLEPGEYRVRFDLTLDPAGQPKDLERPVRERVEVARGEIVEVELVLDHVSPAMVAAGAAAIVVAAVLLHEWLDDVDLPAPPPPPSWALEAAFWVTLDLITAAPTEWAPTVRPPQVTSHFPRAGETVEPGRVQVVFTLSEPLDATRLEPGSIVVEDEDGVEVPGAARWDPERWWLVWEPEDSLAPDSRFHVRLAAEEIADLTGQEIAGATGFEFETAP
jgi:hypothetical protein